MKQNEITFDLPVQNEHYLNLNCPQKLNTKLFGGSTKQNWNGLYFSKTDTTRTNQ